MKNVIIGVLAIAVLVEGYFLMSKKSAPVVAGATAQTNRRPPAPVGKGDKLAGSAMEKYAHIIYPTITDESKQFLTGFDVKTKTLADGNTEVDLVPKDSDDQFQSYIVKPTQSLYFVEMTQGDDRPDTDRDANYRDDYGIVVDAQGIVQ